MRNNRRVLEQEAQLNAPDPRETHPPCYEDAILLPRLDTSFASLKRAGLISDDFNFTDEAVKRAVKRSRCRSEEVLCVGDPELANPIASRMRRHIRAARIRRHRQSGTATLEIPSFATKSRAESFKVFEFGSIEQFGSSEGSPYAKRKVAVSIEMTVPVASTSAVLVSEAPDQEIVIIENHYTSRSSINGGARQPEVETDAEARENVRITPPSSLSSTSTSATSSSESSVKSASPSSSSVSLNVADYSSFSSEEIQDVKETKI